MIESIGVFYLKKMSKRTVREFLHAKLCTFLIERQKGPKLVLVYETKNLDFALNNIGYAFHLILKNSNMI